MPCLLAPLGDRLLGSFTTSCTYRETALITTRQLVFSIAAVIEFTAWLRLFTYITLHGLYFFLALAPYQEVDLCIDAWRGMLGSVSVCLLREGGYVPLAEPPFLNGSKLSNDSKCLFVFVCPVYAF